jgi:TonB family protein
LPQPTPVSGVQAATAVSVSQANPPADSDVDDALAAAALAGASPAVLAALAADAEELDPASSADIIEALPADDAASFDARTPPRVPTPPVTAPPHAPPPTPRAAARPGIVPQMSTPIDAKTAEAKLAAQVRSATPPAVTRLASADLPRSPDFAQPELLDFSEGIAKKRRSRTGTALVRRKKSTSLLMYLALLAAAVAGFFAVVHFFPHGAPNDGTSPPRGSNVAMGTGSAGSADVVAMGTGSAGSSDVVAKGSDVPEIDVDTAGSDTTTGAATPDTTKPGTTTPDTTKPAITKPATTKPGTRPETTKPETTKPEIAKPATTKPETTKPEVTKPEVTKPAIPAEEGCDEVGCVLEKYQRACCERFKPTDNGFHPKNEVPDSLDKSMVKAGIEKVKPKVVACGEKIAAKGMVKLAITVGPEGNISDISVSESPDPALGECVLAAVKRASFGKSVNGASFTYPFAF